VTTGILLLTVSLAGSAAPPEGAQAPTPDGRVVVDSNPIYESKPTVRFDLKKAPRRAAGWSGGSGGSKATGGGLEG
jgi:hypothetical protein